MKTMYNCEYCGFICEDKEKMIAHEKECRKDTENEIMEVFDDFYDELTDLTEEYSEELIASAMSRWLEDKIKNCDGEDIKIIFNPFCSDNWKEVEKNLTEALNDLNGCGCENCKCESGKANDDFYSAVEKILNKDDNKTIDFFEELFS